MGIGGDNMNNKLVVYFGTDSSKNETDPRVGIVENIQFKGNRLMGKLKIDDSKEGKIVQEAIENGVTVCIVPIYTDSKEGML